MEHNTAAATSSIAVVQGRHCALHAGRLTASDKDRIEEEVGLVVKACTAQIEQLESSVVAAAAAGGPGHQHVTPAINKQTEAHLHGVVSWFPILCGGALVTFVTHW